MEDFLRSWSYLGIFLGIIVTGVGFPMPEELPVVIGGALAGSDKCYWWLMLPVCIIGVVVGDSLLYFIGRRWGRRLLHRKWVQKWLPPQRVAKFNKAFHDNGIRILLLARLTPGIRMPIFFTAGLTHLPLSRFVIADAIYAIPGVSFLFFLGWWMGSSIVDFIDSEEVKEIKIIIFALVLIGGVIYLFFYLRRKAAPPEVIEELQKPVPPPPEPSSAASSSPADSPP